MTPLTLIVSFCAVVLSIWTFCKEDVKVIRYVRSPDLVYQFEGMKAAQEKFQNQQTLRKSELDTLESDYRRSLSSYNKDYPTLTEKERGEREKLLQAQMRNYQDYQQRMTESSAAEEQEMLEGVLNQINSFAEQYAKAEGIDLIYGTTTDGSLLYGDPALDITDVLLDALNKKYRDEGD